MFFTECAICGLATGAGADVCETCTRGTVCALLIDPAAQTVTAVETSGSVTAIAQLLLCEYVTPVTLDSRDVLVVNEAPEDARAGADSTFSLGGTTYRGRGIVLGYTRNGATTNATRTVDGLLAAIVFQPESL